METKKLINSIVMIAIGFGIAYLLFFKGCIRTSNEQVNLYENLDDTTVYYKNLSNENVARNSLLETDKAKTFLLIQSRDSLVRKLQARVKEYQNKLKEGGSVTNFDSNTEINNTTPSITFYDTVRTLDGESLTIPCSDTYTTSYEDKYVNYSIKASKDSTNVKIAINDSYSVILGSDRIKPFKKRKEFVEIINDSPYSKVKNVKTYQIQDERKPVRLSLGLQVGYSVTPLGFAPYLGLGVQYNLLNIY